MLRATFGLASAICRRTLRSNRDRRGERDRPRSASFRPASPAALDRGLESPTGRSSKASETAWSGITQAVSHCWVGEHAAQLDGELLRERRAGANSSKRCKDQLHTHEITL